MPEHETLQTEHLVGQRLEAQHRELLRRLHRDPSIARTLSPSGKPLPDEQIEARIQETFDHWQRHGFGLWGWFEQGSKAFVGRIGIKWADLDGERVIELAYAVMPGFWGQGLATEAAEASLDVAFRHVGADEVVAFTRPTNKASQRVLAKLGFEHKGEVNRDGVRHHVYRLPRSRWQGAAKA